MLDTIKPDPLFEITATEEMKLRRTFQVFRVSEFLNAFTVRQERERLKLKLNVTQSISDLEAEAIDQRIQILKTQAGQISDRIKRLNADENAGAGIQIHLKERQKQLDDIKGKMLQTPIYLPLRHDSFVI